MIQILNSTQSILPEQIELDDVVDKDLISLMTKAPISPENFYLTGYETISFKRTREFALETVLASVVPLEKEILIVANNSDDLHIQKLCKLYNVSNSLIQLPNTSDELEILVTSLAKEYRYSHILISCDVNTGALNESIQLLANTLKKTPIKLIVHCRRGPMDLNEVKELNIAYMICNGMSSYISSVVLARRSQLVQSEGISRNHHFDLYNYWQKTLYSRKSGIKPMAI